MRNLTFVPRISPPDGPPARASWFLFRGEEMLVVRDGDAAHVPQEGDTESLQAELLRRLYLGYLEEDGHRIDCFCGELPPAIALPAGMTANGLRLLYPLLGDDLVAIAGRAAQVVAWDRTHRFCGQCATPTEAVEGERARRCPQCGLLSYPRISPAIIIAVVREGKGGRELLLARNHRFPPGRYSVLAGFVEPGESLEECAYREVGEETGIRIENIRYFDSQPWPFPNSLMVGFTAGYAGGDITLEESELADARWFGAHDLPDLPPPFTIARRLIDWFVAGNSQEEK